MSDLSAVVIFLVCLVLTVALVRACEWLRPRDARPPADSGSGASATEVRS